MRSLTAWVLLLTLGFSVQLLAAPGDIVSAVVEPNGWVLDVTMVQPLSNGTTFDYGFTSQTVGGCTMVGLPPGKLIVAMTAAGYNDSAQPTTFSRTVYGTRTLRYPYGTNGQTTLNYIPDITNTNGNTTIRLALSEYVYQTDSNLVMSISANWYSGNAAVTNLPISNNSTNIAGRVVGNWSRPPHQRVTNNIATVACTAFGHGAQLGRPVRCVQFWAVDEFNNASATNSVLEATVDSTQGDAVPVIEYIGHIDCSNLVQSNRLTVHFAAYPWIGDARSVLNTSDGRYSFPSMQAAPTKMFLDKNNSYPVQIAVVSPSGSDSSGQVVTAANFNTNNPPPAFATTGQAAAAIAAKNFTLYGNGMRDNGAGVVYLQPGSNYVFGSSFANSQDYPKTWLTLAPFPNVDRSQVVITAPNSVNFLSQMTRVYNCTFLCANIGQLMGQTDFLWLDHCLFSSNTTTTALIDTCTNWYVTQCIVQDLPQGLSPANIRNSNLRLIRGNNISGMTHDWFPSTVIGNLRASGTNGAARTDWNDSTSHESPSYPIIAFNTLLCENAGQGGDMIKIARPASSMRITNGAAVIQNVVEQVNEGANAVRCMSIGSTSTSVNDTNNADNVFCWNNTIVGQRVNWLENSGSDPGVVAQRNVASLVNNVFDQINAKDDLDYTPSGARTGNWPVMFGVNSSGNTDLDPSSMDGGWHWTWIGINSCSNHTMQGTGLTSAWATYFAFVDRESATVQNSGNAKGNGDYHLQPSSPLWSMKTRWLLPYDIEGKRRSTNDPPGAYSAAGSTNSTPPPTAPSINGQPQSLNLNQGGTATFSVTASGTAPVNYQWRFNGTAISGATSTSLTKQNAQTSDAGSYSVIVTNSAGSVTSADAVLTINIPPSINTQPQSLNLNQGGTGTFSVIASGTAPLNYQWRFNGTAIPGATSTDFTKSNAQPPDAGSYSVVVTNVAGSVTSGDALLTVNVPPSINTQPQSLTLNQGSNATFSVAATGTAPLYYQWRFNSTPISGATSTNFTKSSTQASDAGSYSVVVTNVAGSVTSADAVLAVNVPPSINTQPQSLTLNQGITATFSVSASGTVPLVYQWRFNGAAIPGATSTNFTKASAQPSDAGSYSVIVTNVAGSVTSADAVLTVNVPPSIATQPQSLNLNQGSDATFSVSAAGTAPLNYQWRFNGAAIPGATSTNFTKASAQPSDAGSYSVVVTNVAGSITSADAVLTVNVPPSIATQPQSLNLNQGSAATFSVSASGTAPLNYQWRFNGAAIPGATSTNLTKLNAQPSDAGSYSVVVTNTAGAVTSADAVLTINVPPSISAQPQNVSAAPNATATFTVAVSGTAPFSYQWRLNAVSIPGATTSSYTRSNIQNSDVGSYSVVVTNVAGSATSVDALLTLRSCAITLVNASRNADGTISLTWNVDAGSTYDFQIKDGLVNPQWTTVVTLNSTSSVVTVSDAPVTNTQRFYRLTSSCSASDPAGFVKLALPGNSDSYISLPFIRAPVSSAVVESVSNNIVTVQNSTTWPPNQFVFSGGAHSNTYYLRFNSGAAEGRSYPITNNGTNSLTINPGNDSLASVARNDLVSVVPYWTLGTVFPGGNGVNISPTVGNRNTEVLVTDLSAASINISASKIYYFHAGIWKLVGQAAADHGNDILEPNSSFIVRHNVATNTTVTFVGSVVVGKIAIPFTTSTNHQQDNLVGLIRPTTVSLAGSQLISSGAFFASPLPGTHTDELLTFDNTIAQRNKSATAIYYYWNNAWRRVGAGAADVGADQVFTPGTGLIVRKGTNTSTPVWINLPNF